MFSFHHIHHKSMSVVVVGSRLRIASRMSRWEQVHELDVPFFQWVEAGMTEYANLPFFFRWSLFFKRGRVETDASSRPLRGTTKL